ncbi:MAG: GNAT family N-acetyltransferase [Parvibaculum sp.]|uniref:GNAT family N-acetyltransferase n=1 Tax=Parvibaculum sp. TaxID=2024848 RepID=UPI001DCE7F12|nr:GNAT family N-acetyltransferase [Parvibaculum sp.]MBX3489046.1 GNAT family N-acetyltransferase [Parvibaculum sp.]MBX3496529.1 GNAT family N-acetyltransferase [Parvibaculum sp.]MCW5727085.1 GNAT family N-acetyltransferase [Parvibaculum sp.]
MSVVVRVARDADRPALVRLMGALNEFEAAIEDNRADASAAESHLDWVSGEIAAQGGVTLVAEEGGSVVGFLSFAFEEDPGTFVRPEHRRHALIWDISVDEGARGKGVGRALLEAAEAHTRSAGIGEIRLYVLESNARARRIYDAAGYRTYERLMAKRI